MTGIDNILDQPLFYPAFASKLVGLSTGRIKRWLDGYEFKYKKEQGEILVYGKSTPVIHREKIELPEFASFLELIDLLFVKQFLKHGYSLQKIRIALNELHRITGECHFAHKRFFVYQNLIYVDSQTGSETFELLTGGQKAFTNFVELLGDQIDFHTDSGFPLRWYPIGKEKQILIDPNISFGRPTVAGTGINTETIFNMYNGENENLDNVGFWLNLNNSQIEAAVGFETNLRAA